ncbi:hypothetical protein [Fundidesulfovibrio soli]|uniref:hypothetical protein n=1 Tax=Fundidesulfovibrio soli TaxID=2922716 RepID=UPI001FAFF08C|nr:hypothetical protein [Fundidesulfovibrio soli]
MREPVKKLLAVAAVAGLALISFAGVLARPGIVGHTWDWGVPNFLEQYRSMSEHHFSTWDAYFETGRYHYFKLELLYWQLITPLARMGGEWMSKLLPLCFVTASGLAMLPLARRFGLNWFYATLAALFYALSPYTYSRVVAGHMPMLAGFAIIPLLLLAYFTLLGSIRERGRIAPRAAIACGLLLGLTSMHPSVGVSSAAMLGLLGLHALVKGPGRWRVLASTVLVFALALAMNIHFMAPFLGDYLGKGAIRHGWGLSASAKGEVTVDTELPMREGFHQSTSQPVDSVIRLDLRPGMDTEYAFPAPPGLRAPWVLASLVLAGLALCSFTARRIRRDPDQEDTLRAQNAGMFVVALTGVLLVCGSRTPFGVAFYQGVLKGFVPILFAAFSNTTRWLPLIVTAYALLAFQLPQAWEERGTARRPWLNRAVLAAVLLVFVSPYLGQSLLSSAPKDAVPQPLALKHTPIHPEDAKVYAFLRDQRAWGRVAYLPPVGISWPGDSPYSYEWSSAYSPKPFFLAFYNNPLGSEIISSMYAEQPSPNLDRLFGLASVRYLVYPHDTFFISYQDFQPGYRGEPVVDGFKNYKPVLDKALALQHGLVLEKRFGSVDIYRNPDAAPGVFAASRLLAVADASGRGGNLTAAVLPDVVGMPFYQPGQAVIPAGESPEFLALLGRIMEAGESGQKGLERAFVTDRAGKRQALLYRGAAYELPSVEFTRQGPTTCRVRLTGVKSGFPLLFQETFHDGWKAYLLPADARRAPDAALLKDYAVFPDNQDWQATPDELREYLERGWVSTLGDGRKRTRALLEYGPGGRVESERPMSWSVDFVSRRFLSTVQNDNLPATPQDATWREGVIEPASPVGSGFDALSPASWKAAGASEGKAMPWPEMLHWQASGYGNAWWIDPALLPAFGPEASRYARPNPAGGVDLELVIEFKPQRYYLLGLAVSALSVALALAALGAITVAQRLRVRRLNV